MRITKRQLRQIIREELLRETAHGEVDEERYREQLIARQALEAYEQSDLDSEAFLENVVALLEIIRREVARRGKHGTFMFYEYERMLTPDLENLGRDIAQAVNGWDQGMNTRDLITALESLERRFPTFGFSEEGEDFE